MFESVNKMVPIDLLLYFKPCQLVYCRLLFALIVMPTTDNRHYLIYYD